MRGDVLDHHALAGEGGSAARAHPHADFQPLQGGVVGLGQAGRNAALHALACLVEQQNAAQLVWVQCLDALDDSLQNRCQPVACGQHFQDVAVKVFVVVALFALGDVAGDAQQPYIPALGVEHAIGRDLCPDGAAVFAGVLQLGVELRYGQACPDGRCVASDGLVNQEPGLGHQ